MVPGDLFHVDSLSANGKVVFAEVNAYWRPLLDVYQGGGIYATRTFPRDRPEVAALRAANAQVLEGFGLGWGASHTEFMLAHADKQPYFIETSARVGGANTAEMVEHATGVNLWSEWAKLRCAAAPTLRSRHLASGSRGGDSLARQDTPDTSGFRCRDRSPAGDEAPHRVVVAADSPQRVEELLRGMDRTPATSTRCRPTKPGTESFKAVGPPRKTTAPEPALVGRALRYAHRPRCYLLTGERSFAHTGTSGPKRPSSSARCVPVTAALAAVA